MNLLMLSTISEVLLDNDPILVERRRKKAGGSATYWVVGIFSVLSAVAGVTLMLLAGLGFIGTP